MTKLKDILNELKPKGKWIRAKDDNLKQFKDELFKMIQQTYAPIGGNPKFKSAADINTSDADYWEFIDIDDDPDPDAVSAAKTKRAGRKYVMGANDGQKASKVAYIKSRIQSLKKPGHYVEVSHKIADILLSAGVPTVDSKEDVEKALGKPIDKWVGNGKYIRTIGGKKFEKIMLGRPKV